MVGGTFISMRRTRWGGLIRWVYARQNLMLVEKILILQGRGTTMRLMLLSQLNQRMPLIVGMISLAPAPIQISIQELDYQTQTESYRLTVREVSVMVTMK
ncbi:hypothetical protein T637_13770 [Enterobacter hormaechei subsp. hoffmannii]|nr:hypothetical protein SS12_20830 [Enterobacter hormaechei subsp. hoffmannii]KKJ29278.1 hypothetical protein T637_13770 [Enterobacter hormaechei subsp. hoffmannii]